MLPFNRTSNLIRNTYILQTKTLPVQAYEERCIDTHNFMTYPGFAGGAVSRLDAPTSGMERKRSLGISSQLGCSDIRHWRMRSLRISSQMYCSDIRHGRIRSLRISSQLYCSDIPSRLRRGGAHQKKDKCWKWTFALVLFLMCGENGIRTREPL